jgi:hypothetical protein
MEIGAAVLSGLVGGLAFLVVLWDAIVGGVLEVPFLRALGSLVAPRASATSEYAAGALIHAALSVAFALGYAWILDALDPGSVGDGAAIGLILGLAHAAAATGVVASLARGGRPAHAPWSIRLTLGSHVGGSTAAWVLAHAVFGLMVGTVYLATIG